MDITNNVNKALKGDQEALSELYYATYQKTHAIAISILKNEQDADDIVQESYIKAFSSLPQLKNAKDFEPWLGRIVSNKCKDYLKKNKPILFSAQSTDEDSEPFEWSIEDESKEYDPEAVLVSSDTKKQIMNLLNTLPDEQRICFIYHVVQEMKISEIAELLEVSEGTVKSRINYAKSKMQTKINELENQGVKLRGFAGFALFPFIRQLFASQTTSIPSVSAEILSSTAANAASTATTASTVIGTTAKAVAGKAIQHLGLKIAAGVVAAALTTTAVIGGTGLFSSESETPLNSQGDTIDENVYFDDIVNITDPDELLKDSELFSGDVVIDGKKIHFPCKLSELKECLTLKEGQDFSEYGYQSMKFIDTQGFEYNVSGYNDEKSRDEIYCYSIRAKSNNTNIIFPKGLKMGISRSEVEEIFKDYVDPRPTYSTTRSSSYSDLLLSKDLLENFTRDYAIGNEFNISYSDSLVDGISYSAKFKIEDDLYFNLEIETTEGTVWIPVPLAFEEGAVTVGNCFAVYNYQGKKYIIECYRYTAVTDRWNDTSEQGIIKEINRTKNLYYDGDWYSDTIPTLQYSDELVKCATAFYDSKVTFEKSKISIGESKTVEYPMRGATLVCGFGNTFIRHEYKIFAADFSEIPQAVIEKFESIVNNAAKNIKY